MRVFEREMMRLLLRQRGVNERDFREAANQNYEAIMKRGVKFAPNVDMKLLESKEFVEKEIQMAVVKSHDVDCLLKASPSFAAWF